MVPTNNENSPGHRGHQPGCWNARHGPLPGISPAGS